MKTQHRGVPTTFDRVLKQYTDQGEPFQISTRPYFSSGGFTYSVINSQITAGGATKLFLKAESGQKIAFFSYGIGDSVQSVRLGGDPRTATEIDTNIVDRTNTNNEDFVIEGLSATSRGIAPIYPGAADGVWGPDDQLNDAFQRGIYTIDDIGSTITPPEISSPLALEDALFRGMGPLCELRTSWNRKEGDFLGTVDQVPEGGAKSFLRASGEPNAFDFFRFPEGLWWRRQGEKRDTILSITAELHVPHFVIVTLPETFAGIDTGLPTAWTMVWKLRAHGQAFYLPSANS